VNRTPILLTTFLAPLETASAAEPAVLSGASLLQTLLGLMLVLALIAASAWLLRRIAHPGTQGEALLSTIAASALGPRERVVVIEVAEQWLVLGVTSQSITPLLTLPRGERKPEAGPAFSSALQRVLRNAVAPSGKKPG